MNGTTDVGNIKMDLGNFCGAGTKAGIISMKGSGIIFDRIRRWKKWCASSTSCYYTTSWRDIILIPVQFCRVIDMILLTMNDPCVVFVRFRSSLGMENRLGFLGGLWRDSDILSLLSLVSCCERTIFDWLQFWQNPWVSNKS